MDAIRVLCVDDHPLVRDGIALLLRQQGDIEVVAHAATGQEAVDRFREHHPDITLMDLQMPGMSGVDAIRIIRAEAPDAKIIVLTMYHGEEDVYRSLTAGAATYLLKDTLYDDLVRVIRSVHRGEHVLPAEAQARLAERASHATLTARELDVVRHLASGMRNKQIAASLGISEETVQSHLKSIFAKLGVKDRTAALAVAMRRGLIRID